VDIQSCGLSGPSDNSYFIILEPRNQIRDSGTTKVVPGNPLLCSMGNQYIMTSNKIHMVTPLEELVSRKNPGKTNSGLVFRHKKPVNKSIP